MMRYTKRCIERNVKSRTTTYEAANHFLHTNLKLKLSLFFGIFSSSRRYDCNDTRRKQSEVERGGEESSESGFGASGMEWPKCGPPSWQK